MGGRVAGREGTGSTITVGCGKHMAPEQSTPWAGLNPSPGASPGTQPGTKHDPGGGQCGGLVPPDHGAGVPPPAMATNPQDGAGAGKWAGRREPCSNLTRHPAPKQDLAAMLAYDGDRGRSSSSNGHSQVSELIVTPKPRKGIQSDQSRLRHRPDEPSHGWRCCLGTGTPAPCSEARAQHRGGTSSSSGEEVMRLQPHPPTQNC